MKTNKELIEKLKNGEIAIDNSGNPNVELLRAVLKEAFPQDCGDCGAYSYYFLNSKYPNEFMGGHIAYLPIIPLNDFLEKEQFPKDNFGVIIENNNGEEIINYLVNKGFVNSLTLDGSGTGKYQIGKNSLVIRYETIDTSKTYTLQELKNLENNMENKEIIGYKLIKPEYKEAATRIVPDSNYLVNGIGGISNKQYIEIGKGTTIELLKKAGVLDIWFEPVYKSKEVVITVNNTIINIKGDRMVAEGKEFSIEWLRAIRELFNVRAASYVAWTTEVESVRIGCKTGWTKKHLDEIITAYNELQKQK